MDDLREKLFYEQKNGYDLIDTDERIRCEDYSAEYMRSSRPPALSARP